MVSVLVAVPFFDVCVDDGRGLAATAAQAVDAAADEQHEDEDSVSGRLPRMASAMQIAVR